MLRLPRPPPRPRLPALAQPRVTLMVNNMHHSLAPAPVCEVQLAPEDVCASCFKGPWTNGGTTWSDQMFWFLMCAAHQKQQPVPPSGPRYSVRAANPSASRSPGRTAFWVVATGGFCLAKKSAAFSQRTITREHLCT